MTSDKVFLCPQERGTVLTPSGKTVEVIISYDLGSNADFANAQALEDLASKKFAVEYDLVTAEDVKTQLAIQGTILLKKSDGSIITKEFSSIEGNAGCVLNQKQLRQ